MKPDVEVMKETERKRIRGLIQECEAAGLVDAAFFLTYSFDHLAELAVKIKKKEIEAKKKSPFVYALD